MQRLFHNDTYVIQDKTFDSYISSKELEYIVHSLTQQIIQTYQQFNEPLIIIGVLNGAFIFLSDLVKKLNIPCEIHFIKLSSYDGINSTGTIKEIIGLNADIQNRNVLIVEDIIDTGLTIQQLKLQLNEFNPKNIKVCTLLFKQVNCKYNYKPDFIGKIIPDKFVIGYGLDYNNFGRNTDTIYALRDC